MKTVLITGAAKGIGAAIAEELANVVQIKVVGVGGGGGLAMMPKMEPGQGPKAPIDKALLAFADTILNREVQENNYVSVAFPRFLYKLGAQMGWRQMIKANGGKTKDLGKTPE